MAAPSGRLDPFVSRTARELWSNGQHTLRDDDAAVLFADISGFTRLSERLGALGREGTESVKDSINAVFHELIPIVEDAGGDVLKFGGDALLVVVRGDAAVERAAVAAAQMQRTIRSAGRIETPVGAVRLRMSVGVEAGAFDACLVGRRHLDLMAVSPLMTSLAAAESAASAGEVLMGPGAADLLPAEWLEPTAVGARLRLRRVPLRQGPVSRPAVSEDGDVSALVPPELRAGLITGELEPEHRPVAVAFVALGGTDEVHREHGADELHRRIARVTDILDDECEQAGVVWLETDTGPDEAKWLLVAGMPSASDAPVDAMVGAVRATVRRSPWPLRAGVHQGRVFVGPVGHPSRQSFNVMGDAVNVSARLAARAAPGTLLVSEHALQRSRTTDRGGERMELSLKGRRGAMAARVVGSDEPGSPDPGSPGAADVELIGRADVLDDLLGRVARPGLVRVSGPAGIGKTRVLDEARHRADGRTWWHLAGASDRMHQPYRAAVPWARTVLGIDLMDPAVAGDGDPAFVRDRLHSVVTERLAEVVRGDAAPGPPVLVVEDLQWLDESTSALVEHLGGMAAELGCTVVTSGRDPLVGADVVELGPLSDGAADELILARLGGIADDDLLGRIRQLGAGTPQFLLELAGVARAARRTGADLELPDTIEQVVGARIDALPGRSRRLLRRVAAAGATAPIGLLRAVLADEHDLDRELPVLDGFVRVTAEEVSFTSDLVRVVAYEGLSFRDRRDVHARLGAAIEAHGDPDPALLAEHWLRARDHDRAWRWTRAAARSATARGATVDAARMWRSALAASVHLPRLDADDLAVVLVELAEAAERIGEPDESIEMLRRATRLRRDDPGACAELALRRARVLERSGRYRSALGAVTRARRLAESAGREDLVVRLELMLGDVRYYQGKPAQSLAAARAAIEGARRLGLPAVEAQAHLVAEMSAESLDLPERAAHDAAAERLLVALDDHLGLANLLLNRSVGQFNRGDWRTALLTGAAASAQYRRAGDVVGAACCDNNRADLLSFQHRLDEAREVFTECRRVLAAAGYPLGVTLTVSGLSRVAAWSGELDEAGRLLAQADEEFSALGAADYLADTRLRLAEWHLLCGRADRALRATEDARDLLAQVGEPGMLAAAVDRTAGQAALADGRRDDAAARFADALTTSVERSLVYEEALARLGLALCGIDPVAHRAEASRLLDGLGVVAPPPGLR